MTGIHCPLWLDGVSTFVVITLSFDALHITKLHWKQQYQWLKKFNFNILLFRTFIQFQFKRTNVLFKVKSIITGAFCTSIYPHKDWI